MKFYNKRINIRHNGKIYGARSDKHIPLGGGNGYGDIILKGDFLIDSIDSLLEALVRADKGTVIVIKSGTVLDCTERIYTDKLVFKVKGGITITGDRGNKKSKGPLIKSDSFPTNPLFLIEGDKVRITGIRIKGPDPKRRMEHHKRSFDPHRGDSKVQHEYYYRFPISTGIQTSANQLVIDNCELSGWSHAAVLIGGGNGHHIHHCYIHHNQYNGLGYGVCLDKTSARISHNLFNWNRHSIAGTGAPGTSYEAHDNIELGATLSHCFDMHGGSDRQDGTNIAGDVIFIHHNTFFPKLCKPIVIRGEPRKRLEITNNWFEGYSKNFPNKPAVRAEGNNIIWDNFPSSSSWNKEW